MTAKPSSSTRPAQSKRENAPSPTRGLRDVITGAKQEFESLTGRPVESVSAVHPSDAGWSMCFEVVELERIPASTSVLGTYEVDVDRDGTLVDLERTRRYYRNQAGDGES